MQENLQTKGCRPFINAPCACSGPSKHMQRYIPAVMFSHNSQQQGAGESPPTPPKESQ